MNEVDKIIRLDPKLWNQMGTENITKVYMRKDQTQMLVFLDNGNIIKVDIKKIKQYLGHFYNLDPDIEP